MKQQQWINRAYLGGSVPAAGEAAAMGNVTDVAGWSGGKRPRTKKKEVGQVYVIATRLVWKRNTARTTFYCCRRFGGKVGSKTDGTLFRNLCSRSRE